MNEVVQTGIVITQLADGSILSILSTGSAEGQLDQRLAETERQAGGENGMPIHTGEERKGSCSSWPAKGDGSDCCGHVHFFFSDRGNV